MVRFIGDTGESKGQPIQRGSGFSTAPPVSGVRTVTVHNAQYTPCQFIGRSIR